MVIFVYHLKTTANMNSIILSELIKKHSNICIDDMEGIENAMMELANIIVKKSS